jgi:leucyl/phenylalanyl-tRNA--protein transferase
MLEKSIPEYPAAGPEDSDGSSLKMSPLKLHGHVIPHEPLGVALVRHVLSLAWALQPTRIGALLKSIGLLIHHYLTPAVARKLPEPERKQPGAFGLCGIVGDTSVETMMEGMRRGLYAMSHVDPMKWWSPEERCVLSFSDLKITETTAHFLRYGRYRITFDTDPVGVLAGCATPLKGRFRFTWITPTMMRTALDLFDAGHMHSVDMWNVDGELVGGLYG